MREDSCPALMSTEVPVLLKSIGDHVVWTLGMGGEGVTLKGYTCSQSGVVTMGR